MKQPLWIINSVLLLLLLLMISISGLLQQNPGRPRKRLPIETEALFKKRKAPVKEETIYKYDIFDTFEHKVRGPVHHSLVTPVPEPKIPEPPKEAPGKKISLQSPLNMTLKGIILSADEKKSIAMISDETEKEKNYYSGDQIKDAQVMKISQNRVVVIRANGQHETFRLRKEDENLTSPTPKTNKDKSENKPSLIVKKLKGDSYHIDPQRFIKETSSLGGLIQQHALITAYKEGKASGIRIGNMPEKSTLRLMGLEKGDVIRKINNIEAFGRKNRMKIYDLITTSPKGTTLTLVLRRNDIEKHFEYTLQKIEKPKQNYFMPPGGKDKDSKKESERASKLDYLNARDRRLKNFSQRHSGHQQNVLSDVRKRILENMNTRSKSARMRKH
jgi:type II secretion system protein C